jgi:hypothetical protein
MDEVLILLAILLLSGLAAGVLAREKGRSFWGFFALGFFVPLFGLVAAAFAKPGIVVRSQRDHDIAEAREESKRRYLEDKAEGSPPSDSSTVD